MSWERSAKPLTGKGYCKQCGIVDVPLSGYFCPRCYSLLTVFKFGRDEERIIILRKAKKEAERND